MDLKVNEDGLNRIVPPGYTFDVLQKYINNSCLAERCGAFLLESNSVEQICKGFQALLNDPLNLDEISTLFVAVSMMYFIRATTENEEWRADLLQRTFRHVDTVNPMHLHVATKRMWEGLKLDNINFVFNMLTISHQIALASATGRAIAICLIWAIVGAITETEMEMYCFKSLSDLLKMLRETDDELLQQEESTQIVYTLMQCIGFLVNAIVFGNNEDFKKAGYRIYFTYSRGNLERLKNWAERLSANLKVSVIRSDNYWDLRMAIGEYINSVVAILQDKIVDMQSASVGVLKKDSFLV